MHRLVVNMNEVNSRLGYIIGRYPWYSLCVSLIVSAIAIVGIKDLRMEKDLRRSFSPRDSNSRQETETYRQFFNITGKSERFNVLVQAKDGRTMLRPNVMAEVLQLDAFVRQVCEERSTNHDRLSIAEKDGYCGRRKANEAFHAFQVMLFAFCIRPTMQIVYLIPNWNFDIAN